MRTQPRRTRPPAGGRCIPGSDGKTSLFQMLMRRPRCTITVTRHNTYGTAVHPKLPCDMSIGLPVPQRHQMFIVWRNWHWWSQIRGIVAAAPHRELCAISTNARTRVPGPSLGRGSRFSKLGQSGKLSGMGPRFRAEVWAGVWGSTREAGPAEVLGPCYAFVECHRARRR